MGFWSRVKSVFRKSKPKTTTTSITPTKRSVVVTDYSSGESVKTTTTTAPTYTPAPNFQPAPTGPYTPAPTYVGGGGGSSGGGSTTTQVYTPAPQTTGGQTLVSGESVLVTPSGQVVGSASPTRSGGSPIQPAPLNTIQPYSYTGNLTPQYRRPLGVSLKSSAKAALNVGTIGTQGLGAYGRSIYTPFRKTFTPKREKISPFNINPTWRGTEFGYGLSDKQKENLTPASYRSTKGKTFYRIGEDLNIKTYSDAGLIYTGEPVDVLPLRVSESVSKSLAPKFESQLSGRVESLGSSYQARIDRGDISLDAARLSYKKDVNLLTADANKRFQAEAGKRYETRIGRADMGRALKFQADINEPTIDKYVRTGGTAAVIVGTSLLSGGGSIPTAIAATYWGAKAQKDTLQYSLNFGKLTPREKVAGAGVIALEAGTALYLGKSASSKFYSEWRGIKYSDLARSKGITRGKYTLKTDDLRQFDINTYRLQGEGSRAKTSSTIRLFDSRSGKGATGFTSAGKTTTRIWDPETEKFITSTRPFKFSGTIPTIKPDVAYAKIGGTIFKAPEGLSGSAGQGFFSSGGKIKQINFMGTAQKSGDDFIINTGRNIGNMRDLAAVKGISESSGVIYGGSPIRISGGGVSSATSETYDFGGGSGTKLLTGQAGATATAISARSQTASLNQFASQTIKSSTLGVAGLVGGASAFKTFSAPPKVFAPSTKLQPASQFVKEGTALRKAQIFAQGSGQTQRPRLRFGSSPALSPALATTTKTSFAPAFKQVTAPALSTSTAVALGLGSRSRQAFKFAAPTLAPSIATPSFSFGRPTPKGSSLGFGFVLPTGAFKYGISSKVLKGGRSKTGYTPSFSALTFKLGGAYKGGVLRKSGIDFRPITKGFRFKTGVRGKKKLFRGFI